ncbi:MAG: MBL fold metallo-hydrolase [Deltaproteobacteria bacterium]|nr:MBL fold metallo-hydrolase [Deltaproteobacteria bacterium]
MPTATSSLVGPVRISNVWVMRDGEGRTFLVDAGHALERQTLLWGLRRLGVAGPGDLDAILLTHRHSDHAGNAAFLRERFRAPVHCHRADAVILEGEVPPPRLARRGAPIHHDALCHLEDRYPSRTTVDEAFEAGSIGLGFEAVHVGGHTEGSVMFLHEASGTLFTGDAILAGIPVQRLVRWLRLARPEYSLDVEACHRATLAFLAKGPPLKVLCAGHGPRVDRGLEGHLARLQRLGA